ncbi:unnamed protein product, partial [Rodentolepis nana]|uniref:Uncharacterized protein n=1 Tax=Rodentolepis nana TaxID=102285 RepID=A0A0R3TX01_RODNA
MRRALHKQTAWEGFAALPSLQTPRIPPSLQNIDFYVSPMDDWKCCQEKKKKKKKRKTAVLGHQS